jgi:hypothetical protein
MRGAFADYSCGDAPQPLCTVLEIGGGERAFSGIMPASLGDRVVEDVSAEHLACTRAIEPAVGTRLAM